MLVSFDSMVLIWAARQHHYLGARSKNQDLTLMQTRARFLVEWIYEDKHDVILSTIVASEFLRGVAPQKRHASMSNLLDLYNFNHFDTPAALIAADVFEKAKTAELPATTTRACMKADLMIVACAKAAKVNRFYSHDPATRRYAEIAGIEACDLPTKGHNLFSAAH